MENKVNRTRDVNPEKAQKGYSPRRPNPHQALRMFENKEDMDLYQLSDLLLAKFGKEDKQLTVKALKAQLKNIETYSEGLFNMEDYRIEKRRKIVLPYELYSILLPLIHFNCISNHTIYDVNTLLTHYEQLMTYISNEMDASNRDYLFTIPVIQNYDDSRADIIGIFDETKQLNSLMLHLLPQNNRQQLTCISEEIRSLRQRCYIANLTKTAWAKAYIENPHQIVKLLNHIRSTNNKEPSDYPGLSELLECLTADNIDDVLMHYFIYKTIILSHDEKDIVTRDELFKLNLFAFHVLTYRIDIPERDKTADEHFRKIQLKASQAFDRDDGVENFLYEHIIDMAKLLLFTKGNSAENISIKAKSAYRDALKTKPGYLAPNTDD